LIGKNHKHSCGGTVALKEREFYLIHRVKFDDMPSSKNKAFIIMVVIFLVVCRFLYFARGIFTPFLIAVFGACLIFPLVLKYSLAIITDWWA
jgi:predicted PurR-regulated permease PerM